MPPALSKCASTIPCRFSNSSPNTATPVARRRMTWASTARLYPTAASTPRPISVNMFGDRFRTDAANRSRMGGPANHSTPAHSPAWRNRNGA
jgi:hypothetical protein